ncbi:MULTISPECIES: hypothetical protein, partial [unclassified Thiothrix]|uniref:hypothetical protein n=1 Tax=unclassified Thiothrix TaxID=2636184 RepID=UPI0025D3A738
REIPKSQKYQVNAVEAVIPVSPLDPVRQQLQDMDAIIERLVHLSRLLSESRCQLLARFENNIADRPDLFPAIRQDDN